MTESYCENEEIWKDIPIYMGLYEASSLGRIRTKEGKTTSSALANKRVWKQRIMKQSISKSKNRKNAMVTLWKDGKEHKHLVCRLIATSFHENLILSKMTVNHIDGNPLNNCADNLEWVTLAENIRLGFENGQYSTAKKVGLIRDNGETITARSITAACKILGRSENYVLYRLSGKREYAYSKDWERYRIFFIENQNQSKSD